MPGSDGRVEARRGPVGGTLGPDLTYALRAIRVNPGFSGVAIITLGLGIASATALFSVVDTVIFRPLAVPDPGNVVQVWDLDLSAPAQGTVNVSWPNFRDYASHSEIFAEVAAFTSNSTMRQVGDDFEDVQVLFATSGFLPLLRVEPFLGRGFLPHEDEWDSEPVVMMSHGYWQQHFGGDRDVLGRTVTLFVFWSRGGAAPVAFTVVGVLPPDFHPPPLGLRGGGGMGAFPDPDFLIHRGSWYFFRESRGVGTARMIARLASGVTPHQAQAAMDGVAEGIAAQFPDNGSNYRAVVTPLATMVRRTYGTRLFLLWGAAGLVLLVGGVNVANLLLSRAVVREREMTVRAVLGAGRRRLLRQLLTESLVLGLAGGAVGLPLAHAGLRLLVASFPGDIYRLSEVSVDLRVVAFLTILSVAVGLLFGLWPALRTARPNLTEALKERARGTVGPRLRSLRALVLLEVAAAVLLMTSAGLLVRTYRGLTAVDPGFDAEDLLMLRVAPPRTGLTRFRTAQERAILSDQIRERLQSLPGVVSVAHVDPPPLNGAVAGAAFTLADRPPPRPEDRISADWIRAAPRYLETAGIPLLAGRTLVDADADISTQQSDFRTRDDFTMEDYRAWVATSEIPVVVNETMARRYWSEGGALGEGFYWGSQDPETVGTGSYDTGDWDTRYPAPVLLRIVGVVGEVKTGRLDQQPRPQFYTPSKDLQYGTFFMIRTAVDPAELTGGIAGEVKTVDPELSVSQIGTMEERLAAMVAEERFRMLLVGVFAVMATVLAAVGLSGVMAYAVSRRTHEIGIRVSLGARHEDVLRLIGAQWMGLVLLGTVLGLAGAVSVTRYLASLLYGVNPVDPPSYLASALLVMAVAGAACWMPMRRALRVDPVEALQSE